MRCIAHMQVVLDYAERGVGTQFDQMAVVPGQVMLAGNADEHQLQRQRHLDARVHAHQRAFVGQRGIQTREDFIDALEAAAKQLLRRRIASQCGRQRLHLHACWKFGQIAQRIRRTAIDEHQARGGDLIQHRGIDQRRHQRCGLEAAAFQLAQRGVFPGFGTRAGQAGLQGRVEFGAPCSVAAKPAGKGFQQGTHQAAASGTTRSFRKW